MRFFFVKVAPFDGNNFFLIGAVGFELNIYLGGLKYKLSKYEVYVS